MAAAPAILALLAAAAARATSCGEWNSSEPHSSTELMMHLSDPCRYDKWTLPDSGDAPLNVMTRLHVYYLGLVDAHSLQFTLHILTRFRWRDPRLDYSAASPRTRQVVSEGFIKEHIWNPHVYLVNEHESSVMGSGQKDVLVTVDPDGMVSLSSRMKMKLSCLMDLQKFPFDEQKCPLVLESWTYNSSELVLNWDLDTPVSVNKDLHLPEYNLINMWCNYSTATYSIENSNSSIAPFIPYYTRFAGNYSSLEVQFHLAREVGHYIMDYFMPSILLVVVSWVSFWLDPNAVPGRTVLGTSTMLTFITLTRNMGSALPKVSYIKATEIWFIVCTGFIFGSLVEFAFVNTIWRRKKNVELKKVNSKYILKCTLTPQLGRKNLGSSSNIDRCQSWPNVEKEMGSSNDMFYIGNSNKSNSNTLTVNSTDSIATNPCPGLGAGGGQHGSEDLADVVIRVPDGTGGGPTQRGFTTMTPQEIAQWIDRRSRVLFPVAFVVFNILYWGFVWI
ncbi:pH-sensitive chloride channel 2-like [Bacillus rossius redtenbacheri]|uniref:pH-sensitive chloride channel 2-like n=1 Tax=Bacillus rossius redtenbacheri TaxID=93214 RepID=UPI002FDEDB06